MSCVTISLVLDTSPYSTSPMMPNRWSTSTPRPMSTLPAASTRTAVFSTSSKTAATASASIVVVREVAPTQTYSPSHGRSSADIAPPPPPPPRSAAFSGVDGAVHRVRSAVQYGKIRRVECARDRRRAGERRWR